MTNCTLCKSSKINHLHTSEHYTYLICRHCDLVFVNPEDRLHPTEEKKRYDQHENDPQDENYRQFLSQLFIPLNQQLTPGRFGLDYGAGPGPALSLMFEEAGHTMDIYDPFYAKNPVIFKKRYDFITSTETVEHFYNPGDEFAKLWRLLKPGGYLGMMTLLRPGDKPISKWHYIKDDTHVSLYSRKTFGWIAAKLNAKLSFSGNRVIILKKSQGDK